MQKNRCHLPMGGEEFLILASDTKGENAIILAEKIRLGIKRGVEKDVFLY